MSIKNIFNQSGGTTPDAGGGGADAGAWTEISSGDLLLDKQSYTTFNLAASAVEGYSHRINIGADVGGASNTTRMAETQVMVNDGETIFIGGLINETVEQKDNKLPLLGDIFGDVPFVGPIVKYKSDYLKKTEIIIFVTVHVVKDRRQLNRLGIEGFSPSEHLIEYMDQVTEGLIPEGEDEEEYEEEHTPWFDFRKYE